jgi:hypothetical protein
MSALHPLRTLTETIFLQTPVCGLSRRMNDPFFARLGYGPVRIHAHLYGQKPTGLVRLAAPEDGDACDLARTHSRLLPRAGGKGCNADVTRDYRK